MKISAGVEIAEVNKRNLGVAYDAESGEIVVA